MRFGLIYAGLGVVLVGAIVGLVVLATGSSGHSVSAAGWSTWKPANGTTAKMTKEIADHVAGEYHLNKKGTQLVAVVSGPPHGHERNAQGDDLEHRGPPGRRTPTKGSRSSRPAACGPTSSAV